MVRDITHIRNKNKAIHNIRRKKSAGSRKSDIDDKYIIGPKKHWSCLKCGSHMEPFKEDEYGDVVMSCTNINCVNSKDWAGTLSVKMAKLCKEQQLHSRYYTSYMGDYKGLLYDRKREYNYQPKILRI